MFAAFATLIMSHVFHDVDVDTLLFICFSSLCHFIVNYEFVNIVLIYYLEYTRAEISHFGGILYCIVE